MTRFSCGSNQLTSLDVSYNTLLTHFFCNFNQLLSLNFSHNTSLISLVCGFNQLTSLDVSQNSALLYLLCDSNQLNCLNAKNGNNSNLLSLSALGNPNLSCIEVDDVVWSTTNWTNIDAGTSFDANCFSDCSSVGIDEGELTSGFSLYPNPASNNVTIEFMGEEQLVNLNVVNIHGQQVLSAKFTNTASVRLNVADFSSGIYFTKIVTNEGNNTVKFIKK